jgi:hypothetical protein
VLGVNFSTVTEVSFNSTPAESFTVESDSLIRAVVATGSSTGKIRVVNGDGTDVSAEDFVVIRAPAIATFSPASGPVGTLVTVFGSDFVEITEVQFNGIAGSFSVVSTGQLEAVVPSGASSGSITAVNVAGAGTSVDAFTVTEPPSNLTFTPSHDTFARASRPTNNYGGDDELRVRNTSSGPVNTYLKFDLQGLSGTIINATLRLHVIDASSEGGAIYAVSNHYEGTTVPWEEGGLTWENAPEIAGTPLSSVNAVEFGAVVEFDVTNGILGDGLYSFGISNSTSDAAKYSSKEGVVSPELVIEQLASLAPRVESFTPSSGPVGTEVTIAGVNFSGTVDVSFNGVSASNFIIDSDNQISATVPVGATTGKIEVTNADGTGRSASDFNVIQPPVISGFTPMSGAEGTEVTITGSNLATVSTVMFNGEVSATLDVDSDSQLRASVPSGASSGLIELTNAAGSVSSASAFTIAQIPVVSSFSPASGIVGTNVTINGSNFTGTTVVAFGDQPATFSFISDTELTATVPTGATTSRIKVTNGDGTGESGADFVVILAPTISSFSPTSGPVGTEVTIIGSHCAEVTVVMFCGVAASSFNMRAAARSAWRMWPALQRVRVISM